MEKAVVLAAGKGTRMGALTAHIPKPMIPLHGKPILEHVFDRLRQAGITKVSLVIGYYGEQIRNHFANYPLSIDFREQTVVNGTAKAMLLTREFCGNDPFVLTFGDILCTPEDYRGLMARLDDEAVCAMGVKYADDPYKGAAVYEENDRVVRVVEKPPVGTSTTNWNSAGVYAFRPDVFAELDRVPLSPRGEYELTSAIVQLIESGRTVRMYRIQGDWLDVGRPADLERAEEIVATDDPTAS
jgi:NDP-sugar pyrophosphorylase family protein